MMSNHPGFTQPPGGAHDAKSTLSGPATALLVVAIISIVVLLIAIAFDIFLLASGMAGQLPDRANSPISREGVIIGRIGFALLLIVIHIVVALGARKMKNLESYSFARTASIIAAIPCISPCYVIGIPFGIWAFVSLGKPGVKEAFRS